MPREDGHAELVHDFMLNTLSTYDGVDPPLGRQGMITHGDGGGRAHMI